jgi:hypothetical protein
MGWVGCLVGLAWHAGHPQVPPNTHADREVARRRPVGRCALRLVAATPARATGHMQWLRSAPHTTGHGTGKKILRARAIGSLWLVRGCVRSCPGHSRSNVRIVQFNTILTAPPVIIIKMVVNTRSRQEEKERDPVIHLYVFLHWGSRQNCWHVNYSQEDVMCWLVEVVIHMERGTSKSTEVIKSI